MATVNQAYEVNKEDISKFFDIFPGIKNATIQTFDDCKERSDKKLAQKFHPYDEKKCIKLNSKGAGIFFTVNETLPGKRKKEDVIKINAWIAEIDDLPKEEQMKIISNLPLKPSLVIESKKSYHLFRYSKGGTKEKWADICVNICNQIGGDIKVAKDIVRVLRIPGYRHCKNPDDRFLVKMIYGDSALIYTEEEMLEAFPNVNTVEEKNTITAVKPSGTYNAQKHGIRGALATLNNKEMLSKISGTPLVDNEKIEFKDNSNGTEQIICNGKSTSCRIDKAGMIGGGPQTWIGWCLYYSKKRGLSDQNAKRLFIEQVKKKFKSLLPQEYRQQIGFLSSDKVNHLQFAKVICQDEFLRFCKGGFYRYNIVEGIREIVDIEELKSIIKICLESHNPEFVRSKTVEEIVKIIEQEAYDKEFSNHFLLSASELCLQDGILDIKNMQIRPYSPQDYKFIKLPYPSALIYNTQKPTNLLKVLNEVCSHYADPQSVIAILQQFFGYCLLPITTYQKGLLLHGDGGASKSLVLNALSDLVTEKLVTNTSFAELKEIKQRTLVQHKLIMVSHEMGHNVQLDGEYAKRIIAGEKITGYYLYKDIFEFRPYCKVVMATNNLPYVKSVDNSMIRRMILIIFKREPGSKNDPKLGEKIKSEMDDIFSWAFAGLMELLKKSDFDLPEDMQKDIVAMVNGQLDKVVSQLKAEYKKGEKISNQMIEEIFNKDSDETETRQVPRKKIRCTLGQEGFKPFHNGKTRGYIAPP